jgi:hypothetical protein
MIVTMINSKTVKPLLLDLNSPTFFKKFVFTL